MPKSAAGVTRFQYGVHQQKVKLLEKPGNAQALDALFITCSDLRQVTRLAAVDHRAD